MTRLNKILCLTLCAVALLLLPLRAAAQSGTVTDDAFLSTNAITQKLNLGGQGISLIIAGSSATVGLVPVGATTTYIKFQLSSSLPPNVAAANVAKATLKLYLSPLTSPTGAIDIYPVTSAWSESTLSSSSAPTIAATPFASGINVGTANSFLVVDVTQLVQEWLGGLASGGGIVNDGIALVAHTSSSYVVFDSKESVVTSHEPRLEIVLADAGPQGPTGPQGSQGPQGLQGTPGANGLNGTAATVQVGTTMTVSAGAPASVLNSGTANAAVLNFLIPQGPIGLTGAQGPQGPVGINNRGNWSGSVAYNPNDAVFDSASYWLATAANAGSEPSPKNTNWQLLAGGIVNRGVWSASNSYNVNDAVSDNGSYWLALVPTSGSASPSTSCEPSQATCAADWQLLAAQGAQGPKGDIGPQGPQGIQGPLGPSPTNAAITTFPNSFTTDQTITGNLIIGGTGNGIKFPDGTSLTTGSINSVAGANSSTIASAFLPGALNTPYTAASFTPDSAITITHVTAQLKTAADSSCQPAVIRVGSATAVQDLTLASGQNTIDSGAMALPLSANNPVTVKLQAGATCSAGGQLSADANVQVQYRMQTAGESTTCAASGQVCNFGGIGVCTLTQTDVNNCGSCGNVCPIGATCNQGSCSRAKSSTTLAFPLFNPNSPSAGQTVQLSTQLTFSVPFGVPAATGSVTFLDGGTTLGTAPLTSFAGVTGVLSAQFTIQNIAAGTHSFTVQYAGDGNYSGSTSSATSLTVGKTNTTLAFPLINPNSPSAGQTVQLSTQLTFSVPFGVPAATGSVTFLDGGTTLGTAPLTSFAGVTGVLSAQFTIQNIAAGTHSFTVQYVGDSNYNGSTSPATTVTVN